MSQCVTHKYRTYLLLCHSWSLGQCYRIVKKKRLHQSDSFNSNTLPLALEVVST